MMERIMLGLLAATWGIARAADPSLIQMMGSGTVSRPQTWR